MLNKMKAYCKGLIKRLLKRKNAVAEQPKQNRYITKMDKLKLQLKELNIAFDKKIADKEKAYIDLCLIYDAAFEKYSTIHAKFNNGAITDQKVLHVEQGKLTPLEEELKAVSTELDKLKQAKKEEVLKLVNQMNAMQTDYVEAKTENIKVQAYRLQKMKLNYLEGLSSVGADIREILKVEQLIKDNLASYGFEYTEKVAGKLAFSTKHHVPITIDNFTIDTLTTAEAFNGEIVPYSLYETVRKGKAQNYIK